MSVSLDRWNHRSQNAGEAFIGWCESGRQKQLLVKGMEKGVGEGKSRALSMAGKSNSRDTWGQVCHGLCLQCKSLGYLVTSKPLQKSLPSSWHALNFEWAPWKLFEASLKCSDAESLVKCGDNAESFKITYKSWKCLCNELVITMLFKHLIR